jgi:hypothetical protein
MWRPPEVSEVSTLPGHQLSLGLRISRALVRMNRKAPRKPASAGKPALLGLA